MVEAAAHGRPVIGSDDPGIAALAAGLPGCITVPAGDVPRACHRAGPAAERSAARRAAGSGERRCRARAGMRPNASPTRMEQVYERAIAARRPHVRTPEVAYSALGLRAAGGRRRPTSTPAGWAPAARRAARAAAPSAHASASPTGSNSPRPSVLSRSTGMSLTSAGVPHAQASSGGSPNPSYSEGYSSAAAPVSKATRSASVTWPARRIDGVVRRLAQARTCRALRRPGPADERHPGGPAGERRGRWRGPCAGCAQPTMRAYGPSMPSRSLTASTAAAGAGAKAGSTASRMTRIRDLAARRSAPARRRPTG